jgi:hypothetical protein
MKTEPKSNKLNWLSYSRLNRRVSIFDVDYVIVSDTRLTEMEQELFCSLMDAIYLEDPGQYAWCYSVIDEHYAVLPTDVRKLVRKNRMTITVKAKFSPQNYAPMSVTRHLA